MKVFATTFRAWLAGATCLTAITSAMAQTTPAPAAETPPPGYWINGIHLSAQIEAGIVANPSAPDINDGQLFTDRANQPILNQILFGAERKIDPKATGFDYGFKLSLMYGADARYSHFLGFLDQALPKQDRNQFDVVEASATLHAPIPFMSGGMEIKAGLWPSPLGSEVIDPSGNPFYSHSYIFNFAMPLKHTGILTTSHVTDLIDIYLGVDTGENTTFGPYGDDNGTIAGIVGFGLNMLSGNLTLVALSHLGPENPTRALTPIGFNANAYMRYENDAVLVWKYSDALTLTTEAAWTRDDFGTSGYAGHSAPANAFGIAQYASYTLTDSITLNARAEVFRDDNGFFVAGFPGNYDFVYSEKGVGAPLNTSFAIPPATYGEITLGLTFKPTVPAPITSLAIRPEIRYDQSLGGNNVFNRTVSKTGVVSFKDSGAFTFATDVILTF
jgi:hypothetical protein